MKKLESLSSCKLDNSKLGSTQQQKICWHWHVARIISSQKIYGLYGWKHHIVEMRRDVTDAGQPIEQRQVKIELLSQWKLEAESRKKSDSSKNVSDMADWVGERGWGSGWEEGWWGRWRPPLSPNPSRWDRYFPSIVFFKNFFGPEIFCQVWPRRRAGPGNLVTNTNLHRKPLPPYYGDLWYWWPMATIGHKRPP